MLIPEQRIKNLSDKQLEKLEKKLEYEKAKYSNFQQVAKVVLNSAYGAVGNKHFLWYDLRQAEAITLSGQLSVKWVAQRINEYLSSVMGYDDVRDFVVYIDTDSNYIDFSPIVKAMGLEFDPKDSESILEVVEKLDKLSKKKIEPKIDEIYSNLFDYMNAYKPRMKMKREAIAQGYLIQSKKHYAMNVWDDEGVRFTNEPKLKITGFEAVKSSTPSICREAMKDAIKILLSGTEQDLIEYNTEFKKRFKEQKPLDIAFPSGVNNVYQYTDSDLTPKKGTPVHVRGSIVYNNTIKRKGLSKILESIKSGDKIKYIYLKEPNPVDSYVIAFHDHIPDEFEITDYIDYDKQFYKSYLKAVESLANILEYDVEYIENLQSFFV